MLKKLLIITISTAVAFSIMSGGYALWRSELTITGEIHVTVPDTIYENATDVVTFSPMTLSEPQQVSDVYNSNHTVITILE